MRRAELGDLRLEALELRAAAGMRLGAGALPDAERAARTAVELAPFRESARAALMEVLAARGNVAEALRAFEDARVLLREELGSSPGPALVALHERLVREEPVAPVAPVAAPSGLVERDAEVALLGRLAAEAAAGEGRTALIEGPAGLGKTRLLGELRKLAEAGGARVLSARASDLERDYPFGVVRQLLEGVVLDPASAERALAGAAAPARAVFEFSSSDQSGAFAALHGLYWVCVNLAGERPLAVVVDDIHWADSPSLRFLAYLARRLEGLPVLLAATLRTGEPGTDLALMAEIAEDAATTSVRPGPLSAAAVAEVARMRLGPGADDAFCAACHVTTGGNPLLLRQLLTALEAEGVEPDEAHADVVRAIGSRAIAASVVRRLSRLPAGAGALGRAVAVLGDGAELAPAAALASLAEPDAASAAALLSRAEILRAEAPLAFVHPLVRDAVYRDIPPGERELAHERAARVLRDAAAPVDQIAGHLLLAPRRGEPWVAEALLQTGGDALRRGAPDPAVAHLRRALAEPPPAEARPGVLLELGLAELVSSEPLRPDTLEEAYATVTDPGARLVAAHALARTHLFAGHPAEGVAVVERAIADLPPGAEDERLGLEAVRLCAVWFGAGDPASLDELAAVARARAHDARREDDGRRRGARGRLPGRAGGRRGRLLAARARRRRRDRRRQRPAVELRDPAAGDGRPRGGHGRLARRARRRAPRRLALLDLRHPHLARLHAHPARRAARRLCGPRGGRRGVPALRLLGERRRLRRLVPGAGADRARLVGACARDARPRAAGRDRRERRGAAVLPQCAAGAAGRLGSVGRGSGRRGGGPAPDTRVDQPAGASVAVAVGAGPGSRQRRT